MPEHDSTHDNVQIIKKGIERHNDPETREEYLADYSEDLTLHGTDADSYEELVGFYEKVWEMIPDLTVHINEIIAEGDEVAVRYSWEGTHAVTDEEISLESGLTWFRFEDGEIVERWVASGTGDAIKEMLEP